MSREREFRDIRAVETQSGKGDEHVRFFDGRKNGVNAIEKSRQRKTREQTLTHGTLDHTHEHAGWNAMARDVGEISEDSLLRISHEIHQVAANLGAGNGSSVSFHCGTAIRKSRHQGFLKFVREGKLGLQLDVGDALGVGEVEEQAIAEEHGHHETTGI